MADLSRRMMEEDRYVSTEDVVKKLEISEASKGYCCDLVKNFYNRVDLSRKLKESLQNDKIFDEKATYDDLIQNTKFMTNFRLYLSAYLPDSNLYSKYGLGLMSDFDLYHNCKSPKQLEATMASYQIDAKRSLDLVSARTNLSSWIRRLSKDIVRLMDLPGTPVPDSRTRKDKRKTAEEVSNKAIKKMKTSNLFDDEATEVNTQDKAKEDINEEDAEFIEKAKTSDDDEEDAEFLEKAKTSDDDDEKCRGVTNQSRATAKETSRVTRNELIESVSPDMKKIIQDFITQVHGLSFDNKTLVLEFQNNTCKAAILKKAIIDVEDDLLIPSWLYNEEMRKFDSLGPSSAECTP